MSEIDRYRRLQNRHKEVKQELLSSYRRLTKLEAKIERRRAELIEIGQEMLALTLQKERDDN